jgi:transposase
MRRTQLLQEVRKVRFEEILRIWTEERMSQEEAARMLGVCSRTFRRYIDRYHEAGLEGLADKRLSQASARKAPVDESLALCERYRSRYRGWNVKHFHSWYRREGGGRSYTWVKNRLQAAGDVAKAPRRGAHRRRRDRAPVAGMMLHQDGSTHEWVPDKTWDLIVTMDDATSEHYSMFFVEQEGTVSSFLGIKDVILIHGLFCSLYTDRGSHYWNTAVAGGKVDKKNLTQFGRAMHQLGIEMIAAYSPEAPGRSERMFRTIRTAWSRNWPQLASPRCPRPTATSPRSTCRRSIRSSWNRPESREPASSPPSSNRSRRFSASTTNGSSAATTASRSMD